MGDFIPLTIPARLLAGRVMIVLLLQITLFIDPVSAQDQTDVVRGRWLMLHGPSNTLYGHIAGQAVDMLEKRSAEVSEIRTVEKWKERQLLIEKVLMEITGPFPEKTPLNAKTVKTIDKGSYRIEHVIYESQPGFYVTSSLFIPRGTKKNRNTPAIIYCSGHSEEGYRSPVYLHVILNLVSKGFIVFAFDPVGQGERLEYFDPETGKSRAGGPTREHSYPGAQTLISGRSQALYMIWDGIRAVDYLYERKEVDPERIGITGRSGGGTQSAYISAFDNRILAAAPENYITNYTRLLQSIGPQDAEQNLSNLIAKGLDHPDFLIVRAPKPALMITTSEDMFSIQGAMETEKEVSEIYRALGHPGNFRRTEDDAGHASTKKNREAMYAFFSKHLNHPCDTSDIVTTLPDPDEMKVTPSGQVSTSLASKTVFLLNRELAVKEQVRADSLRKDHQAYTKEAVSAARILSGYREPDRPEDPVLAGRIIREGYTVERFFVNGEGSYVIPYLLFRPGNARNKYMIYLHPGGKSVESDPGGEIEKLVKNGYVVLAPDLPGTGEIKSDVLKGDAYFDGISHNIWYASMLTGRSITGILAGDVARLAELIRTADSNADIGGFARGELSAILLHAAAFTKSFESVTLIEPLSSYTSVVMNRYYDHKYIPSSVPGALKAYDLPDLAASLAPAWLTITGIKDATGHDSGREEISRVENIILKTYSQKGVPERLRIISDGIPGEEIYRDPGRQLKQIIINELNRKEDESD